MQNPIGVKISFAARAVNRSRLQQLSHVVPIAPLSRYGLTSFSARPSSYPSKPKIFAIWPVFSNLFTNSRFLAFSSAPTLAVNAVYISSNQVRQHLSAYRRKPCFRPRSAVFCHKTPICASSPKTHSPCCR